MPTFSFDKVNRIIKVAAPDTEVTIQQLINAVRDWEDEPCNMEVTKVADASGKDVLGGGLAVGITLKLLNWKVKFEDRSGPDWVDCDVTGGNLLAVDANGNLMSPIEPASYVTITVSKSVSAVLLQELEILAIKTKTDNLPNDPASETDLAATHGSGSWEGTTPTQLWQYSNRKLTSRDIESQAPDEHLPSEDQLSTHDIDIKALIAAIKEKTGTTFRI